MNDASLPSESGIRELVRKLHEDGVESGRQEARQLIEEARQHAAKIVDDAHHEAEELLRRARETSQLEASAAREALVLAVRDALLTLKEELQGQFAARLRALVDRKLRERDLLREMILELAASAGRRVRAEPEAEITLSTAGMPDQAAADDLIAGIARELLAAGVTLHAAPVAGAGIVMSLRNGQVDLLLTDAAIAEVLHDRLLPRFHDLLSTATG